MRKPSALALAVLSVTASAHAQQLSASPSVQQQLQTLGWNGRYAADCSRQADMMIVPPPSSDAAGRTQAEPAPVATIESDASGKPTGLHLSFTASNDKGSMSRDAILRRENDGFVPWQFTVRVTMKQDIPPNPDMPNGLKAGQVLERQPVVNGLTMGPDNKPIGAATALKHCG